MEIDLQALESRHAHDLLGSAMIPRPIAWVSTLNPNNTTNLAPFSFFTGVSWSPPILAFSPVNRADGSKKDTVCNIETTPEFVVHMVSIELLQAMEASARPILVGQDEEQVPVTLVPSRIVRPLRIAQAKVAFECTLERIVRLNEGPNAGNLILGRVQMLHVADTLVKNGREIDWQGLDVLGRLSGNRYCTTHDMLESETN